MKRHWLRCKRVEFFSKRYSAIARIEIRCGLSAAVSCRKPKVATVTLAYLSVKYVFSLCLFSLRHYQCRV